MRGRDRECVSEHDLDQLVDLYDGLGRRLECRLLLRPRLRDLVLDILVSESGERLRDLVLDIFVSKSGERERLRRSRPKVWCEGDCERSKLESIA